MSAQWRQGARNVHRLTPMREEHLDTVMAIENAAYALPWTRGNFVDSIASGYLAHCLLDERDVMLGYCVATRAADEIHLLNLTVDPHEQGRGHARHMLDMLVAGSRAASATQLWLEVRESNTRARDLYRRYGMAEVGLRKGYYPAAAGLKGASREDAVVMRLAFVELT
ncbi:MAG TPA: ribosomal protein S18-alanine N-acetyltransferase [Casimicrobiaceae bacterium]